MEGKGWKQDWPEGELSCDAMGASLDPVESSEGEMILNCHPRRSEGTSLYTHMSISSGCGCPRKGVMMKQLSCAKVTSKEASS